MRKRSRFFHLAVCNALLLVLVSASAPRAFEVSPVALKKAFQSADVAVVGRIQSGAVAEGPCAATYVLKIATVIKGAVASEQRVTVAGGNGYKIGASYLMFLAKDDRSADYTISRTPQQREVCARELHPDFYEDFLTSGPSELDSDGAYKPVVLFPERAINVPPEVYKEIHQTNPTWAVRVDRLAAFARIWADVDAK